MGTFDPQILTAEDRETAYKFLPGVKELYRGGGYATKLELPDLVIAPDGVPYLYRWYLTPPKGPGNVYFHIQVASDPLRPLHDHPWDNQSVILSGGYDEVYLPCRGRSVLANAVQRVRQARKGDVVHRLAEEPHRLVLPDGVSYTMTLFTTGPKRRDWGFHAPDGWVPYDQVTETKDGLSVWKEKRR